MTASLLTTTVTRAPVAVIGVGNALMRDDGVGPAVIAALERGPSLGAHVELVDAGTAGFDLMHQLLGRERVILIDAVAPRNGEPPGTVLEFSHRELLAMRRTGARASPHEPGILAALQVAELAGALPQVTLLGVVPADLGKGTGLSAPIAVAVHEVVGRLPGLVSAHGNGIDPKCVVELRVTQQQQTLPVAGQGAVAPRQRHR